MLLNKGGVRPMNTARIRRAMAMPGRISTGVGRRFRTAAAFTCSGVRHLVTLPARTWWLVMRLLWRYLVRHAWVKVAIAEVITGPTLWYALSGSVVAQWVFATWFCVLLCLVAYAFTSPLIEQSDVVGLQVTGFEGVDTVDASDTLESTTTSPGISSVEAVPSADPSPVPSETQTGGEDAPR